MRRASGRPSSVESTIGFGQVVLADMLALVHQLARADVPSPHDRLRDFIGSYVRIEAHELDHLAANAGDVEVGARDVDNTEPGDHYGDEMRPIQPGLAHADPIVVKEAA